MVLMLQKEVVERILAKPNDMNLLALSVQFYAQPKKLFNVSKNNFYPAPKVDSAVIKISNIKKPAGIDEKKFFNLLRAGFSSKRKQLKNNLKPLFPENEITGAFEKAGINLNARAQELSLEQWKELYKSL